MSNTEAEIDSLWNLHMESEFAKRSPEEALATMTDDPRVTTVATLIGGRGREEVRNFYANHFLNQLPDDLEVVPISRTIGQGRLVDELVVKFTHTKQMDWVLPGLAPTGKRIEFAMVAVIYFQDGKIAVENLYWDNGTILRQAGLLPDPDLPVIGAEAARLIANPTMLHNQLLRRG